MSYLMPLGQMTLVKQIIMCTNDQKVTCEADLKGHRNGKYHFGFNFKQSLKSKRQIHTCCGGTIEKCVFRFGFIDFFLYHGWQWHSKTLWGIDKMQQ